MPNWVSIRLTLSGPPAEIMRFQNTCIRATPEENSDDECLDLGALVPMPAKIVATLDDDSAAAKQAALDATGFEDIIADGICLIEQTDVKLTPEFIAAFIVAALDHTGGSR